MKIGTEIVSTESSIETVKRLFKTFWSSKKIETLANKHKTPFQTSGYSNKMK